MGKTNLEHNASLVHEARMKVMEDVLALQKKIILACMEHDYESKYDISLTISSSSLDLNIWSRNRHTDDTVDHVYSNEIWGFDSLFEDFDRNYLPILRYTKTSVKKTMDMVFYDKFREMEKEVDKYIGLNKKTK